MKKISKIEPKIPVQPKRRRVAAYVRVSRSTERLLHSAAAQISYYNDLIQNNPEWIFSGVYADTGFSGLSTADRDEFARLLADCDSGKIDIILCKSISRFARNTVDLLNAVRHLKEIGVEVRFEKEHINSLSEDGELMLTLLASFSQEESRSISENVKWGLRKRMQSGEIGMANKHILGYQYDDEKQQYVIIPKEAEIVRWMFQMYIDGVSLRLMAQAMNDAGVRSVLGNEFTEGSLRTLIFNEIYAGDLLRQKCFMENPVTKHKVLNHGELPQYLMTDCHEPIIDRETYAKVQAEMKRRESMLNPTYCFTGKIKCGICGQPYTRKKGTARGKVYIHWICRAKKENGMTCKSVNFSEQSLYSICSEILGDDNFESVVKEMTVTENGDILFRLTNNEIKVWKNYHITKFHHEGTDTPCFDSKIFCEYCGNSYRIHKDGKYIYWQCRGKYLTGVHCKNKNYTDYQLRQISAYIMETEAFSETEFEQQIQKITVLKNGDLQYHFKDGRIKAWRRM